MRAQPHSIRWLCHPGPTAAPWARVNTTARASMSAAARVSVNATARATWLTLCMALMLLQFAPLASAQSKGGKQLGGGVDWAGGFGDAPPMAGGGFAFGTGMGNASFSATYELEKDSKKGRVHVQATIADGWHMYSTTQAPGGPMKTELKISGDLAEATGPFTADHSPDTTLNDAWPGLPIEEHHGAVTWTAPITMAKDFDPEQTQLGVSVSGQVCKTDGACVPVKESLDAKFTGYYGGEKTTTELRVENTHAVWTAIVEPGTIQPGQSASLRLKADTDKGYHVYPFVAGEDRTDFRTLIVATNKAGLRFGTPTTAAETVSVDIGLDEPVSYYKGDVEWMIPIQVPESAKPGEYPIELQVAFMTCQDVSCDPPAGLRVSGTLQISSSPAASQPLALNLSSAKNSDVVDLPNITTWIDSSAEAGASTADATPTLLERAGGKGLELWMVFAALAGGFILNFMPCVLPVIGLKLMSFVNQSGNNHARVVSLNVMYVVGILAVMLILALANISAKLAGEAFGWGQQFTRIEFQVPMAVLIFAMALSFLGIWEIPIPGFAMSSKSGELMEKEGLSGAFFKGVLTTVLATPCSGPFLGTLFGLTLTLSVMSILLLYALVGIGLGLPYLALCIYPGFIKMMPKPGAWMETLKQVLAFPLLLTVVYFVAMINPDYRIATLILLIVVWFACWLIGRVPAYAELRRIGAAWIAGLSTAAIGGLIAFSFFGPVHHDLDWVPYNEATLAKYRSEGKTVMVEFTARWCLTCQSNMKFAIDRPAIAELVDENEVVPLLADWSEPSDEILSKLKELDSLSIPLLAIYPADPEAEPIILRDAITESQLLKALEAAGPSRQKTQLTSSPLN